MLCHNRPCTLVPSVGIGRRECLRCIRRRARTDGVSMVQSDNSRPKGLLFPSAYAHEMLLLLADQQHLSIFCLSGRVPSVSF